MLGYCVKVWRYTPYHTCRWVIEKAEETTNDQQIRKHELKVYTSVNLIYFFPGKCSKISVIESNLLFPTFQREKRGKKAIDFFTRIWMMNILN